MWITLIVAIAVVFVAVKYVWPFIRTRNAVAKRTLVQPYGPQGGLPPTPGIINEPADHRPQPKPPLPKEKV